MATFYTAGVGGTQHRINTLEQYQNIDGDIKSPADLLRDVSFTCLS